MEFTNLELLLLNKVEDRLSYLKDAGQEFHVEERVMEAMKIAVRGTKGITQDRKLVIALAASLQSYEDEKDSEDYKRLQTECNFLRIVSSALQGIKIIEECPEFNTEPIGILGMWVKVVEDNVQKQNILSKDLYR